MPGCLLGSVAGGGMGVTPPYALCLPVAHHRSLRAPGWTENGAPACPPRVLPADRTQPRFWAAHRKPGDGRDDGEAGNEQAHSGGSLPCQPQPQQVCRGWTKRSAEWHRVQESLEEHWTVLTSTCPTPPHLISTPSPAAPGSLLSHRLAAATASAAATPEAASSAPLCSCGGKTAEWAFRTLGSAARCVLRQPSSQTELRSRAGTSALLCHTAMQLACSSWVSCASIGSEALLRNMPMATCTQGGVGWVVVVARVVCAGYGVSCVQMRRPAPPS